MKRWIAGLIGAVSVAMSLFVSPAVAAEPVVTPPEHRRSAEQTYLTFPEWFLVHSPAELAQALRDDRREAPPSSFPSLRHIGQFWSSYANVSRAAAQVGDVNLGYHVMVLVIGLSTTVEYALKEAYEASIGRLFEALRTAPGASDAVYAAITQDYVDFIRVQPWYEYDFVAALRRVWGTPALPGGWRDQARHWERRWLLTTEYGVKAGYGRLIKLATQTAYDAPLPTTAVLLDRWPTVLPTGAAQLQRLAGPQPLGLVPRYQAFQGHAQALADSGLNFVEIAGNRGDILVSLWADARWQADPGLGARVQFSQPLLTRPGQARWVLAVPVGQLAEGLRQWQHQGLHVEHVYDF